MIVDGATHPAHFEETFDWVIVGSGAAGATAARVLADTGASIAVLEEGPRVETREFGDTIWPAMRTMFREQGAQVARGRAFIPVVQGACLGGSTVINSAIMWRLPDDVWEPWKTEYGLGDALPLKDLHAAWDRIEGELGVRPVAEDAWGANRWMQEASAKLGVSAAPTRRGDAGCKGSARCLTGCPHAAKQSMHVSYLPYAEKRGATLVASAKAERVVLDGGRATAVAGRLRGGPGLGPRPFIAHARRGVIVAASAIQTPQLLAASGVRSGHLGLHFQAHPGGAMIGVFDRPVNMWFGATQGYDADHWRRELRAKIETISLPPEMVFARIPGAGRRWVREIARAGHMLLWAVQLRAYARGRVRRGAFGADIRFDPEPRDMENYRKALRRTADLLFAAGAREVRPGIFGFPESLAPGEAEKLEQAPLDPRCYSMILSHLFGTARMSAEPGDGVVGTDFAVHGTKNLYVVDSSIFPTNLGVNPQEAIMGVAWLAARRLAEAR
ncbi:MAG: GMC family oxidoreductase [Elusimicrobia bacterium]|nr:GMC family oxidoreductase [Elusimicrobiota bacterium]